MSLILPAFSCRNLLVISWSLWKPPEWNVPHPLSTLFSFCPGGSFISCWSAVESSEQQLGLLSLSSWEPRLALWSQWARHKRTAWPTEEFYKVVSFSSQLLSSSAKSQILVCRDPQARSPDPWRSSPLPVRVKKMHSVVSVVITVFTILSSWFPITQPKSEWCYLKHPHIATFNVDG